VCVAVCVCEHLFLAPVQRLFGSFAHERVAMCGSVCVRVCYSVCKHLFLAPVQSFFVGFAHERVAMCCSACVAVCVLQYVAVCVL